MTAVAKASSKTPADHSRARPHRFARVRWPVRSSRFLVHGLPATRGFRLCRVTVGSPRRPPGLGFPTICGCYPTCDTLMRT
jgi:hypothetical protein